MSLPNYLAKIKSSGIYRFVWDKSEVAGVPADILRLVVGYSDKGPFNTPVYITRDTEFKAVFGDISKKLEKRGIWFHRMALQALSKGPIIALNLKKFDGETVKACSFNVKDSGISLKDIDVESIYDTSRFWKLDPEAILPATAGTVTADKTKYISITSADSKDTSCSLFIRGYKPTGYDVTIKEWYSVIGEEVPDYFVDGDKDYSSMLVSDFFAEVYVFKGKFTAALCAAEPLNKYFDVVGGEPRLKEYLVNGFGDKVDTLSALAADEASNFVNVYSGCLLPFFKNQQNSYISLDLLFNADNPVHKMMMNLNSDLLYNNDIEVTDLATTGWLATDAFGAALKKTKEVYSSATAEKTEVNNVLVGVTYDYKYAAEEGHEATAHDYDLVEYKGSVNAQDKDLYKYVGGKEYKYVANTATILGSVVNAIVFEATGEEYANYERIALYNDQVWVSTDGTTYTQPEEDIELQDLETLLVTESETVKSVYRYEFTEGLYKAYHLAAAGEGVESPEVDFYVKRRGDKAKLYKKVSGQYTLVDKAFEVVEGSVNGFDFLSAGFVVGDRIVLNNDLATITSVTADFAKASDFEGVEHILSRKDTIVKCNHSCSITSYNLKPFYFEGYTYKHAAPKNANDEVSTEDWDKLQWQKFILSALVDYEGLRVGLTSRKDIDFRYVVDTFEAFVDEEVHKELALICKEKDNAVAFLNFPAVKTFKNCQYSSFTDEKGRFQVKYIAEGANKKKNAGVLFSLVSEPNGASFASYNTPLLFTDGTVKNYVPAAALVSNNFMDKYAGRQPYYVVAGPTYGRLVYTGMVGPDFNYTRADLDILEPMGVNVTVYVPRLGTYINSNQTAKQTPVTALSKLNIRELVIYLQDEIEALLQAYQWEFNTPYLRDLIKAKADTICERVKNNGGIKEFLNVCDESNNTDDVLDAEMFVLSTSIEPGRACGKMVQELTIYRSGQLRALIK